MKVPKQWRHWCKKVGLKPTDRDWLYLIGRGRVWRLNGLYQFECSLKKDFSRWAIADKESLPMPKTEREFLSSVKFLCEKLRWI
jgi:hypothetical protein